MRTIAGAAALLALAACGKDPVPADNSGTIRPAEIAPQPSPTAPAAAATPVAAPSSTPEPVPTPTPAGGEPAVPPPGAPIPTTSLSEAPFTRDSAQGAATVVQTYYALIGEGRYRQAWRLWDRGGAASGTEATAFAASFADYRDYRANVGGPGEIEGAAGSRYVGVPVQVTATPRRGGSVVQDGTVTLRRVGDVDGATPEQRRWHIATIALKPAKVQRPR